MNKILLSKHLFISNIALHMVLLSQSFAQSFDSSTDVANSGYSSYGDYHYVPQKGAYRGLTLGEALEDFGDSVTKFSRSVSELNQFAGWSRSNSDGNLQGSFFAGVNPWVSGGILGSFGQSYGGSDPNRLALGLGPVILDNFSMGYGAIYADGRGEIPGKETDDGWGQILWLQTRASFVLGNTINISITPFVYWLPNENQVGWGLPAPIIAGLNQPAMLGPNSLAQIIWSKQVGMWRLAVYDQFSPFIGAYSFLDASLFANGMGWFDMSPVDQIGRYGLGYGLQNPGNYQFDTDSTINARRDRYEPFFGFYNNAGARAYRVWDERTQSMFYLDRIDLWDKNFDHNFAMISGGTYTQTGSNLTNYWAGYNFVGAEPFDAFIHNAVVGSSHYFSSSLFAYAQAGYYWTSGQIDEHGFIGNIGINQQLGVYDFHGIAAGRRVFHPGLQKPGIEDFVEYRLSHRLGPRSVMTLVSGFSERHTITRGPENDVVLKFAGLLVNSKVTDKTSAFLSAGWENIETEFDDIEIDRWLYRIGLQTQLTHSLQSYCYYTYEDTNGSTDYSEHAVFLGIQKFF